MNNNNNNNNNVYSTNNFSHKRRSVNIRLTPENQLNKNGHEHKGSIRITDHSNNE